MVINIMGRQGFFRNVVFAILSGLSLAASAQELQLEIPFSHPEGLTALASPDSSPYLYSAGKEGAIYAWDKKSGKKTQFLSGHTGGIEVLKSYQNVLISSGREEDIYFWNAHTGKLDHKLKAHKYYVEALDICPIGGHLVSGSRDNTVKVWSLPGNRQTAFLNGHEDNILAVAIHPDNQLVASSAERHSLRVWDIGTQEIALEMIGEADITDVAFSPDGRFLIGVMNKKMLVWEVGTWALKYHLRAHTGTIEGITFWPGTTILTSIDYNGKVIFWDLPEGKLLRSFIPGPPKLTAMSFSANGKELALGFEEGIIQIWNVEEMNRKM